MTNWLFVKIETVIKPTAEQRALLDQLKTAATQAADGLKAACPRDTALTPTGRLQAMLDRLEAALNASHTVHAPLITLYGSLSDEQKAQFDAVGPDAGPKTGSGGPSPSAPSPSGSADAMCSDQKPGLTDLPMERIVDVVHPSDAQQPRLDELRKANDLAIAILQSACPDRTPRTPMDRLDAVESRLNAMIRAAKAVQPALGNFYGSLTDEQKARMNLLGRRSRGDV
jgi:hypothetical protein